MYHEETAEDFLSVPDFVCRFGSGANGALQPGTGEKELLIFLTAGAREARWEAAEGRNFTLNGEELKDGGMLPAADGRSHILTERGLGGLLKREYTLRILQSENLASVYLTTQSGSMDYILKEKGNGEEGFASVVNADGTVDFSGAFSA